MKRMNSLVCTAAIILISGIAVSDVYAQYGSRSCILFLSDEWANVGAEEADRAACHEWAVAQTGHDPSLVFAAQRSGGQREQSPLTTPAHRNKTVQVR